jgi:hypothetical protein
MAAAGAAAAFRCEPVASTDLAAGAWQIFCTADPLAAATPAEAEVGLSKAATVSPAVSTHTKGWVSRAEPRRRGSIGTR